MEMVTYSFVCSMDNHQTIVRVDVRNPPIELQFEFEGMSAIARIFWFSSPSFSVEVACPREVVEIGALANHVSAILSGIYDSFGLSEGMPTTVTIGGFVISGTRHFANLSQSLPKFRDLIAQSGVTVHDWMHLCLADPYLRAALRDIRLAMQTPGEAAVHCYRAIERVRQAFSSGKLNRLASWDCLREAINVDRSWLDTYTSHATAIRHGELIELPHEERNKCMTQAATVAIRYAAYLKAGRQKLTEPVFARLA